MHVLFPDYTRAYRQSDASTRDTCYVINLPCPALSCPFPPTPTFTAAPLLIDPYLYPYPPLSLTGGRSGLHMHTHTHMHMRLSGAERSLARVHGGAWPLAGRAGGRVS